MGNFLRSNWELWHSDARRDMMQFAFQSLFLLFSAALGLGFIVRMFLHDRARRRRGFMVRMDDRTESTD